MPLPRPDIPAPPADPLQPRVRAILNKLAPTFDPASTGLISAGHLDSLALARFIVALESEFQIRLPRSLQTKLAAFDSLDSICSHLAQLLTPQSTTQDPPSSNPQLSDPAPSDRSRKCLDFLAGPRNFDLLILGSSRVQTLSSLTAAEFRFRAYNFSVYSARTEDWYAIHQFVLRHNPTPLHRVVLGLDVEAFADNMSIDPRLGDCPHLAAFLDPSDQQAIIQEKAAALAAQGPAAREQAILHGLRTQPPQPARRYSYAPDTGDMIDQTGDPLSRTCNQRRPLQLTDPAGMNHEYRLRMVGFERLNPKRLGYFIRFVQACLDRGTAVSAFLTPLHPALHRFLCEQTNYGSRMRELVDGLRANRMPLFELHDFSTPHHFGGSDDDFVDAAHMGPVNCDLLLRRLLRTHRTAAAG